MSTQETTASGQRGDLLAGAVVALAGLALLVATFFIPDPVRHSPGLGPRMLPGIISTLLLVSGVLLALTARRRHNDGVEEILGGAQDDLMEVLEPDEPPVPMRGFLIVLGLLVGYAVAFIPLGFMLSTSVFLGLITTYVDPRRWVRNWLFAAIFSVAVYYLFTQVLAVVLPAGLLG